MYQRMCIHLDLSISLQENLSSVFMCETNCSRDEYGENPPMLHDEMQEIWFRSFKTDAILSQTEVLSSI